MNEQNTNAEQRLARIETLLNEVLDHLRANPERGDDGLWYQGGKRMNPQPIVKVDAWGSAYLSTPPS